MNRISSLNEIPELTKANVFIKDAVGLLAKLNQLFSDGHSKLQIVTDFDYTLTRHTMNDKSPVLTSYGMFRECPSVPQSYKDEDVRLANIYKPIESDPSIPIEEKIKHMEEWYTSAHNILKGIKFPRKELMEMGSKMVDCFRDGVTEMIDWSEAQQVPVLVFSAGLGNSVIAALTAANYLRPNVKVVSNILKVDENDIIVGMQGKVIHTFNKNETAIKGTEYYSMVRQRSNVVVMGDMLGDAGMAEGLEARAAVLKLGFLASDAAASLATYLDHFDLVLRQEHTLDLLNAILKRML